jgi:hypothetical protein
MVLWVILFVVGLAVLGGLLAVVALRAERDNGVLGRRRPKLFGDDARVDDANREQPRR